MKTVRLPDVQPDPPPPEGEAFRLLTLSEVARELRCSKGHVQHLIHGKVPNTRPLPSVLLGRRRMIRRSSMNQWIAATEATH